MHYFSGFVVNGINNVNVTSIERRFQLSSSHVGLISSAYDISAAIFILPITFYATYGHKPRMLAFAAFIMALGSFIMSIPHFASGQYELRSTVGDRCGAIGKILWCVFVWTALAFSIQPSDMLYSAFRHGASKRSLHSIYFIMRNSHLMHNYI